MIFDRSAVQRLANNGRLPLTPSTKKDVVASFLVVDGNGNDRKPVYKRHTPVKESAILLTKSPPSRASTSPTLNETQSITPLSEYSPSAAGSVEGSAANSIYDVISEQDPNDCNRESRTARSDDVDCAEDRKRDLATTTADRRDIAQDRIDDVFLRLETGNEAKEPALGERVDNGNEDIFQLGAEDDFALIKVRHNDHVRLVPISSRADDVCTATKELALLLRVAFGISQQHEVVGLIASSCDDIDQSQMLVAPLSTVISGRFVRENSVGKEFELLIHNGSDSLGDEDASAEVSTGLNEERVQCQDAATSDEEASAGSESDSGGFVSIALYVHIIQRLVTENELDAIHGEALSAYIAKMFGQDGVVTGPLQVAYFLFAEFHRRIDVLTSALGAIAEAIVREQCSDGEYDEDDAVLQLSSLSHLLDTAEFLYSSNDLSVAAYVNLCQAIIESDPDVASVYQSYRMCLEQDYHEVKTGSLDGLKGTPSTHSLDYLLYAIKDLGETMEPTTRDLPQDEHVSSTTKDDDSSSSLVQGVPDDHMLDSLPDTMVAAVTTLVEHGRITMDEAAELTSSFGASSSLNRHHECFLQSGDGAAFLNALHSWLKAPQTSDTQSVEYEGKENIEPVGSSAYGVFLRLFKHFDATSVAALRMAVAQRDPLLRCALEQLREDGDTSTFRQALLQIADIITDETVNDMPAECTDHSDANEQILNERRYGLRLLLAYLVQNGTMKATHGSSLLDRFDSGDSAVHDALCSFEASYDASAFVVRIRSI